MKKIMMFTAPWCAGCKTLKPHLEKLRSKIEIEYIDVEAQPGAAEEYGISNLPTLFFVNDGELVKHRTGSSEAIIRDVMLFAEE
jgi:thioredoxin 1